MINSAMSALGINNVRVCGPCPVAVAFATVACSGCQRVLRTVSAEGSNCGAICLEGSRPAIFVHLAGCLEQISQDVMDCIKSEKLVASQLQCPCAHLAVETVSTWAPIDRHVQPGQKYRNPGDSACCRTRKPPCKKPTKARNCSWTASTCYVPDLTWEASFCGSQLPATLGTGRHRRSSHSQRQPTGEWTRVGY